MHDSLPNVDLPKGGEWIDIHAELGIAIGTPLIIQALSSSSVQVTLKKLVPDADDGHQLLTKGQSLVTALSNPGVWASSQSGGAISVNTLGSSDEYTSITTNSSEVKIAKGQLTKVAIQARIGNENVESSREVQGVVSNGNIIGQIFKASKDNITALMLTLESAAGVVVDNFESYNNDAELQTAWPSTGALPTLETTTVFNGTKAMSLPTTNNLDEWQTAAAPTDFTDFTGTFKAFFSHPFAQQQIAVFIGDGTNTKSFLLAQDSANTWGNFEVNEKAMTEDQAGTTNIAAITEIGYRVILKRTGGTVIIDDLTSVPPPGDVEIKLWDMGVTLPASTVDSINSGTQYTKIGDALEASFTLNLLGGVRLYHIDEFTCGADKSIPTNELLNTDHYYIIEVKWIDTDVNVYGVDTTFGINYYQNGYAFTAPDEATAITQIGEFSDLMFAILSTQDIYITKAGWRFDAPPNGDSEISVFLEDNEMKVSDVIIDREHSPEQSFTSDLSLRPQFLVDGGKLEYYYNDDYTDNVSKVNVEMQYFYIPPVING